MQQKICGGYVDRPNKNNPSVKSLHAYGIAVDINTLHNPNKKRTAPTRFSSAQSQTDRQKDVHHGKADTDFTPDILDSIRCLSTPNGYRIFNWGGDFRSFMDTMHFELACLPEDLATMSTMFEPAVQAPAVLRQGILV